MTGYKKIFLDTTPIIYFLDADINYAEKVERIFEGLIENRSSMVTSTVTCTEYKKIDVFFEFLTDCNVQIQPIDINTAKKAAQIRARYKDFKTMDCLQLATACLQQCDLFLTNDRQLRQFDEVKCMVVDDFNQL